MRDSTAEWLTPLKERAEHELLPEDVFNLMLQATMPAVEAEDSNFVQWAMEIIPDAGRKMRIIDWIEFGQLLRKKLEWWDYADSPSEDWKTAKGMQSVTEPSRRRLNPSSSWTLRTLLGQIIEIIEKNGCESDRAVSGGNE